LWREFLSQLSDSLALRPGCPPAELADTEARLGERLPRDLAVTANTYTQVLTHEREFDYRQLRPIPPPGSRLRLDV